MTAVWFLLCAPVAPILASIVVRCRLTVWQLGKDLWLAEKTT